jgi:ribonuclease HI
MELAAIEALEALQRAAKVILHTVSKYLLDGITKWIKGLAAQRLEDRGQEAGQGRRPVARTGGRDKAARCHRRRG